VQVFLERLFDGISNGRSMPPSPSRWSWCSVGREPSTSPRVRWRCSPLTSPGGSPPRTYLWCCACSSPQLLASLSGGDRAGPRAADRETQPARHAHRAPRLFLALNSLDGILWGNQNHSMPSLFPNGVNSFISVDGARLYWANLGVWLLVALLVGAMFQLFNRTRLGLHMRATASNRESAALAGIPTGRILLLGWASRRRSGPWQGCSSRRSILTPSVSARCSPSSSTHRPPPSSVASTRRVGRHRRPLDRRRRIDAVGLRLGDRGQLQEAIAFVAIVMSCSSARRGSSGRRRSSGYDDSLATTRQQPLLPVRITQKSPAHRFLQVFGIALLVALAIIGSRTNSFREGQLTQALIYASAIAGLNLATGYTGMLSIGHSAFFGIGAYTTASWCRSTTGSRWSRSCRLSASALSSG